MAKVAEVFALAWNHHQTGNFAQAEQLYKQILQQEPGHVDAWCLLGAVCQAQNKLTEGEACYRKVLQLWPGHPIANNGLGIVLAQQGKRNEAVETFQQLIIAEPTNADAHNNLGLVRLHQQRFDEAMVSFQRALQLRHDFTAARDNLNQALQQKSQFAPGPPATSPVRADAASQVKTAFQQGMAHYEQGRFEEAVHFFGEALRLQPAHAEIQASQGNALYQQGRIAEAIVHYQNAARLRPDYIAAHYNLGVALQDQGKMDEAAAQYRVTLRLDPKHATAHNNLGLTLLEKNKVADAVACFQLAIKIDPKFVEAHVNLANAEQKLGNMEQAIKCNQEALRIDPKCVGAWNNLGMAYKKLGQFDEAMAMVEHALQLSPNDLLARWNRAVMRLLRGEFELAWPDHESRWVQPGFGRRTFTQPLWDGSDLQGKTILLYAEQGFGDALQFIRYVPLVKERGGKVIVQCHGQLLRLLQSVAGIDRFEVLGAPLSAFDVHAALLSLPGIFHTTLANVPAKVPYLQADAALVEHWQRQLEPLRGFKIGIAWQGNPGYREDHERSFPLACFAPLAQLDGVQLISLQKGYGTEQLPAFAKRYGIHDLGKELDETSGAFMDTAAVIKNLDLVISSDTAIPHLAGALGAPVWVALPRIPDWRWLLEREDCPWYPTMRLFRQRQAGDWAEVFERIAAQVKTQL